ncbi:hypothetical protein FNV43_RR10313 [Rhamnella rubrinervis]|uniref:Uncharacterized protein n=1 Tax=Rhamnella rubrinervis TaxID=2594499 RepID=A0A8K0MKM8_9ROSA|nr:hypothetical protein FNV43_RR10313 [Rhamnella rubrinervis]
MVHTLFRNEKLKKVVGLAPKPKVTTKALVVPTSSSNIPSFSTALPTPRALAVCPSVFAYRIIVVTPSSSKSKSSLNDASTDLSSEYLADVTNLFMADALQGYTVGSQAQTELMVDEPNDERSTCVPSIAKALGARGYVAKERALEDEAVTSGEYGSYQNMINIKCSNSLLEVMILVSNVIEKRCQLEISYGSLDERSRLGLNSMMDLPFQSRKVFLIGRCNHQGMEDSGRGSSVFSLAPKRRVVRLEAQPKVAPKPSNVTTSSTKAPSLAIEPPVPRALAIYLEDSHYNHASVTSSSNSDHLIDDSSMPSTEDDHDEVTDLLMVAAQQEYTAGSQAQIESMVDEPDEEQSTNVSPVPPSRGTKHPSS